MNTDDNSSKISRLQFFTWDVEYEIAVCVLQRNKDVHINHEMPNTTSKKKVVENVFTHRFLVLSQFQVYKSKLTTEFTILSWIVVFY